MEPITTGQICRGAVPFVVIQSIILGLVITFPQMVMHYKKPAVQLNQQQIDQQFNNIHIAGIGGAPGGCHRSISASRHEFSDGEIARLHAPLSCLHESGAASASCGFVRNA
jgi:hypothetical protein